MQQTEKYVIFANKGEELVLLLNKDADSYSLPEQRPKSEPLFRSGLSVRPREKSEVFYYEDTKGIEGEWLALGFASELKGNEQVLICESLGKLWPLFGFIEKEKLPSNQNWIPFIEESPEGLCFYGGTFKPWHEGHDVCLRLCPMKNIVVILDTNPFKGRGEMQKYFTEYLYFKDKLTEYGKKLGKNIFTFPGFFGAETGNPTSAWLPELKLKKRMMLMGDDNFKILEKWVDYESLLTQLDTLYVVPRVLTKQESLDKREKLLLKFKDLDIQVLPDHPFKHISSTSLREE